MTNYETNEVSLCTGMILDRCRELWREFTANATGSLQSRALAPHSELAKHYYYRPIEEFTMDVGTAAPWFGSFRKKNKYTWHD